MTDTESALDVSTRCPICLEQMTAPIKQCVTGHSICGICIDSNNITNCPICRSAMTSARNYQLEEVMETLKSVILKIPCTYASNGCKEEVTYADERGHQLECPKRNYVCEGKKFAGWTCSWTGQYKDILDHFTTSHKDQLLQFKGELEIKLDPSANFNNIWLINFYNGCQIFWLKYIVNVEEEKIYLLIQYVGSKEEASNYYYEAEITEGNIRKLKVTEICESHSKNGSAICKAEKCATFSFATIKSFLNQNDTFQFRFRVMGVKKEAKIPITQKPQPMPQPIPQHMPTSAVDFRNVGFSFYYSHTVEKQYANRGRPTRDGRSPNTRKK